VAISGSKASKQTIFEASLSVSATVMTKMIWYFQFDIWLTTVAQLGRKFARKDEEMTARRGHVATYDWMHRFRLSERWFGLDTSILFRVQFQPINLTQ
jgi:hypothetical protein